MITIHNTDLKPAKAGVAAVTASPKPRMVKLGGLVHEKLPQSLAASKAVASPAPAAAEVRRPAAATISAEAPQQPMPSAAHAQTPKVNLRIFKFFKSHL